MTSSAEAQRLSLGVPGHWGEANERLLPPRPDISTGSITSYVTHVYPERGYEVSAPAGCGVINRAERPVEQIIWAARGPCGIARWRRWP